MEDNHLITMRVKPTLLTMAALLLAAASPLFAAERYVTLEAGAFAPQGTSTVGENLSSIDVHYKPGSVVGGS